MRNRFVRMGALLGAALALVGVTAATLPAHAAIVPPQFSADSGDRCPYGVTQGTLGRRSTGASATALAVDVKGTVVDQPTPAQPRNCPADGLYSSAQFTAYYGSTIVARQSVTVDNAERTFSFTLGGVGTIGRIDRLVVQVCRYPNSPVGVSYCGAAKTYRPVLTW